MKELRDELIIRTLFPEVAVQSVNERDEKERVCEESTIELDMQRHPPQPDALQDVNCNDEKVSGLRSDKGAKTAPPFPFVHLQLEKFIPEMVRLRSGVASS